MDFFYQAEKFATARRSLMLPHPRGEAQSIAHAFHECSLGLHQFDRSRLDDDATAWINKLEEFMDTTGIDDPTGAGTWSIKAARLTSDQKIELSRIVDELAHWFQRQS